MSGEINIPLSAICTLSFSPLLSVLFLTPSLPRLMFCAAVEGIMRLSVNLLHSDVHSQENLLDRKETETEEGASQ